MYYQQQTQTYNYQILNIDYHLIQDKAELQKIIVQYNSIIQNKIKQINELANLRDKQYQQREMILNRMLQNRIKNDRKIKEYQNSIYQLNENYQKIFKDIEEEKQKNKKNIQGNYNAEIAEVNKKIEELQLEYKKHKDFQDMEAQYIARIQQMKKQLITCQYQHHDNMNKEEVVQLKQNNQLITKNHQEITQTKKNAHFQAITKISSEVQSNEEQNLSLKSKLIILQNELSKLKKERNDILNKRKDLKINICLNEEELEEYKAVGSLQKAKIKAYKDKVQNLKVLISQEVSKKEKAITDRKKQREGTLKTLKLKLFNFQKQKQELKIKMEKMKLLGQTIIEQRVQVEDFFVMALDACKKQVQAYDSRPFKMQNNNKTYGQKVDIDELLPRDKQRILTNLYTKLAFGGSK